MLTSASSEKRKPAAHQILDPRLRYAAALCSFVLCPIMLFEASRDFLHQLGPCPQIRSLLGGVRNRVPNTLVVSVLLISCLPTVAQNVVSRCSLGRWHFETGMDLPSQPASQLRMQGGY
jgi:hypothetical protein